MCSSTLAVPLLLWKTKVKLGRIVVVSVSFAVTLALTSLVLSVSVTAYYAGTKKRCTLNIMA